MAIDFPNTPTVGQLYTVGTRSWKWDGDTWNIYAATPAIYVQDSAPTSPINGDQWYETDTGRWFLRYQSVWVEIGNSTDIAGALQPSQITALTAATTLTSVDVFPVVDDPATAVATHKITYGNLVTNMSSSLAPGLVLITSGITTNAGNSVSNGVVTVGSAVSSVEVNGVFSANYDSYKIIYSGGNASADNDIRMTLGSSLGGYYGSIIYAVYVSGTVGSASGNNLAYWTVGSSRVAGNSVNIEIHRPFIADETWMSGNYVAVSGGSVGGSVNGYHNQGLSYSSFTFTPGSGTLTGGTIRVYGYRN